MKQFIGSNFLKEENPLADEQFENINTDAIEIIKLITAIFKTTKSNINH